MALPAIARTGAHRDAILLPEMFAARAVTDFTLDIRERLEVGVHAVEIARLKSFRNRPFQLVRDVIESTIVGGLR